jgi:ATP-dependent Clp protease ATP-binding subunit ClpA
MGFPEAMPVATERSDWLDPARTGQEALALESSLRELIIGQEEAVQQIVSTYQMYLTGLASPGRPVANLLFLGPTGSGKTRIVEATAQALTGNPNAVIKIDCAEFQHSHEIAKLIGSPPGYLGHRETEPLLTQQALDQHHTEKVKLSFVLFDEIEKASDAVWNLLLGILDKATLRLGDNRKVDFSRAMIFMTSNLGATEMGTLLRPRLGFAAQRASHSAPDGKLTEKIRDAGQEAARRKFNPEFINRLDKIVVFSPLGEAELRQILDLELRQVQQRLLTDCAVPFGFSLSEPARDHLLSQGTDARYGARHLKRTIERLLVQPMCNLVASRQLHQGDWLRVEFDEQLRALGFLRDRQGAWMQPAGSRVEVANRRTGETSATGTGTEVRLSARARPTLDEVKFGE